MDILEVLKKVKEDVDFNGSEDFIADALLDSYDIVNLVDELEDSFSIEINGSDIIPDNFVSIQKIEQLVERYR